MTTNHNVPSSSSAIPTPTMDNVARAIENFSAATNALNQALLAATLAPNAVSCKQTTDGELPDELIRRAQGWRGVPMDYVHYLLPPVCSKDPEVEAQLLRNILRMADEDSVEYSKPQFQSEPSHYIHCKFTINGFKFVVLVSPEAAEVLHVI